MSAPLLFDTVLKVLAMATRQEEDIEGVKIREHDKLSLFSNNMVLYLKDPTKFTKSLRLNEHCKIAVLKEKSNFF